MKRIPVHIQLITMYMPPLEHDMQAEKGNYNKNNINFYKKLKKMFDIIVKTYYNRDDKLHHTLTITGLE